MSPKNNLKKILIIDFGSQFTQLIARRIRELGVFSEIISHKKINNIKLFKKEIKGVILSGGPLNVYDSNKFKFNNNQYKITIGPGGEMVITKVCGTLVFGSIPSQGTKK